MVKSPRLAGLIKGHDHGGNGKDQHTTPADRQPGGRTTDSTRRPLRPTGRWAAGRLWLHQRRDNPPLLHATHRAAYGSAFSLACGIGLPHCSHVL
jgi:hypothetical protein